MMNRIRLAAIAAILPLLAACGGSSTPPEAPEAAAPEPEVVASTDADTSALEPLFGTWALDPARCDGPVLNISLTRFEGVENGCEITSYTDNGDGTFTADMTCEGEGQTADERIQMRPVFAPTGEGIDLTYLDRDNLTTTVLRCPEPVAAN